MSPRLPTWRGKQKGRIILGSDHSRLLRETAWGSPQVGKEGPSVTSLSGTVIDLSMSSTEPRVCVKRKSPPEKASDEVRTRSQSGDPSEWQLSGLHSSHS